jgi:CBS domain-containing protein
MAAKKVKTEPPKVEDIMVRNVATISKEERVTKAGEIMSARNIGSLIVVDNKKPVGIITERDFLRKIIAKGLDPNRFNVEEVMTSPITSISPKETIFKANQMLQEHEFRRLAVEENNELIGIITETDVSRALNTLVLDIIPSIERSVKVSKGKYDLRAGVSYLIEEDRPDRSVDIFVDQVLHGKQGLAITRINPSRIREKYGLKKTPIIWLTNVSSEGESIYPTDLEQLSLLITNFITKATRGVVLLEGLEYLITNNSFNRVMHMLEYIRDKVSTSKSFFLAPISPRSLDERDLKLLEREMDEIEHFSGE